MSFKEKANSRLIKMRDTVQGYYLKKDEEKKKRMSLIKQYFYSITSFEKYSEFVKYSFTNNFLYLFILVLIAAILSAFSVSYTFDKNYGKEIEKELAEVGNYIITNIEDVSITNGKLKVTQSDVIKINNTNKVFDIVIIDTRDELNDDVLSEYKQEITKEKKAGVILTQDKVYFNGINSKAGEEVKETTQKEETKQIEENTTKENQENVSSQEQINTNIIEFTPTVELNQASQEENIEESKEETQTEQRLEETQKTENAEQQNNTINENNQEEASVINQNYFSEYTYSDLLKEFKLEDLDKAGVLMLCTPDFANAVIRKIDLMYFQDYLLIAMLPITPYCLWISILIYLLFLILIGKLLAKIFRITTDTKAMTKIAIHSLTLPLTLLWIYTIVQTFTGFTIQHFILLFLVVAIIYILAVLLISKTDIIATAKQEVINQYEAKKKEEEEKEREEEEKRKKEEEKKKEQEKENKNQNNNNNKNNKKKKSKQKSDTKDNLGLEGNQ